MECERNRDKYGFKVSVNRGMNFPFTEKIVERAGLGQRELS